MVFLEKKFENLVKNIIKTVYRNLKAMTKIAQVYSIPSTVPLSVITMQICLRITIPFPL